MSLVTSLFCALSVVVASGHSIPKGTTGGGVHPTSLFASIVIDGDCSAQVKYTHPLDGPPPHAWYHLEQETQSVLEGKLSVPLGDLEGRIPLHGSRDVSEEGAEKQYLVVVHPNQRESDLEAKAAALGVGGLEVRPSWAHMFPDPRFKHLHGFHGGNEESSPQYAQAGSPVPPKLHVQDSEVEHVWFPGDAKSFDLYCANTTHKITLPLIHESIPKRRPFSEQAETADVEVINEATAGPPDSQLNIIFLAGGFLASEKATFLANVTTLNELMMDPQLNPNNLPPDESENLKNMHRSVPFNRYWPFWNVYAVWQPSLDSGASRPLINLELRNNLGCQHPDQIERAVFCDRDLSLALADTTPARPMLNPDRCLIIVIVNTPIYGGSGLYIKGKLHIGNFFNQYDMTVLRQKEKMLSLMDHEIGHSFGDLADEYDTGSTETSGRVLRNCQRGGNSGAPSEPQWQHWIDIARADPAWQTNLGNGLSAAVTTPGAASDGKPEWHILSVPEAVCGFSNYYKPAAQCMLHRLSDFFMCPVCREQSTLAIMQAPFEITWPRKPLEDTITLVPINDIDGTTVNFNTSLVLHLPIYLTPANQYSVEFTDFDGTPLPKDPKPECPVCVTLTKANFAKYPVGQVVKINATVKDNTVFITDKHRADASSQLVQTTFFQVMVVWSASNYTVDNNVTLETGNLTNVVGIHEGDKLSRWTLCPKTGFNGSVPTCKLAFTSKVYEAPSDIGGALASIEIWVYVAVGGLALIFLLLWLYAAGRYKKNSRGIVRPIFQTEFSCFIKLVRFIMMFAAILFMVASLGTMALGVYYYTSTSALGKIIIFSTMGLATGLYLMAFIGYWAVSSRSKRMLLVNGLVLFLGTAIIVGAFVLITFIGEDMKKEKGFWTDKVREVWRSTVSTYPDRACAIQGMLKCSGYNASCASVVGSTLDCPVLCQKTNERYFVPCRNKIRKYIWDNYHTITQVLGGCAGLQLLGIVLNFILFCGLISAKNTIKRRHEATLKRMKEKNKQKAVEDRHKALYILKSLGDQDTAALVREFQRMDIDKSGSLSKREMFLFLKGAMCYKAKPDEIECIFELADNDGDGTIQLDEFLAIFGRQAPRQQPTRKGKVGAPVQQRDASPSMMRRRSSARDVRRRMREKYHDTGLYDEDDDNQFVGDEENPQGVLNIPTRQSEPHSGLAGARPMGREQGGSREAKTTTRPPQRARVEEDDDLEDLL